MTRYHLTFTFKDTRLEAAAFCDRYNSELSPYERRAHKIAHYAPWTSADGKEQKFICFHFYKA